MDTDTAGRAAFPPTVLQKSFYAHCNSICFQQICSMTWFRSMASFFETRENGNPLLIPGDNRHELSQLKKAIRMQMSIAVTRGQHDISSKNTPTRLPDALRAWQPSKARSRSTVCQHAADRYQVASNRNNFSNASSMTFPTDRHLQASTPSVQQPSTRRRPVRTARAIS